ncbi:MAG: phytanoyl-CoA dioxygenase family protein [Pseudomonadota bacterium]
MAFDYLIFDGNDESCAAGTKQSLKDAGCIMLRSAADRSLLSIVQDHTHEYFVSNDTTGAYMWVPDRDPANPDCGIVRSLWHGAAKKRILDHFPDRRAVVLLQSSIFRWMSPDASPGHLQMHQDARVVPEGDRLVTAWVPIWPDQIDRSVCGLEFVPNHHDVLHDLPENARFNLELSAEWAADKKSSGLTWRPELQLGDVLLFSGRCPHGSEVSHSAHRHRLSIEIRFVPLTDHIREIVLGDSYPVTSSWRTTRCSDQNRLSIQPSTSMPIALRSRNWRVNRHRIRLKDQALHDGAHMVTKTILANRIAFAGKNN